MRLVTYDAGARGHRLGALLGDRVLDLADAATSSGRSLPTSMQLFIEAGEQAWSLGRDLIADAREDALLNGVALLAPLPRPTRLRDASLFLEHMEKALALYGKELSPRFREQVIYYNADHLHIFGPDAEVVFPRNATWIDFELEWACIVGKSGSNISPEHARDHIFGFTIFNDWSERGSQIPFMEANVGPGVGKDFANGLGPCIATWDEFDDPYALEMLSFVNGERWTKGSTSSMHWRFEDAIVQFSADRTIEAGEVIGSGTVLNGCGLELGRRLEPGDVVRLEIEGIGVLENRVALA